MCSADDRPLLPPSDGRRRQDDEGHLSDRRQHADRYGFDRPKLVLGTRASPLALRQSEMVAAEVCRALACAVDFIELQKIITQGDKRLDKPLAEIGGKGLFTEELEAGLRDGTLDFAVHSLKDLPTEDADGLVLAAILPREDARDVLVPRPGLSVTGLADLPHGARLGTASLRRKAQALAARPDLAVAPLRGNVGTRLSKLAQTDDDADGIDATLLAAAGLTRLGVTVDGAVPLAPEAMLPAAGQGALAVQCRADDEMLRSALARLHCPDSFARVTAERAFLNRLDGSCRTPIAAHAEITNGRLTLRGRLLHEDGTDEAAGTTDGLPADAAALGRDLADRLRAAKPHLAG